MSKRNPARNVRPGLPKWNSVSGTDHELYVAPKPEKAKRAGSPAVFHPRRQEPSLGTATEPSAQSPR
jgi:hypothetical protein